MVLIIVMGGNVIVFFHGGVSLLTGIAHSNDNKFISLVAKLHTPHMDIYDLLLLQKIKLLD